MRPYSRFERQFHDLHGEAISPEMLERSFRSTDVFTFVAIASVTFMGLSALCGMVFVGVIFLVSAFSPHPTSELNPDAIPISAPLR